MVCVPSRGAFSWVQLPRRCDHSLRCPRSCRLARPSGRRCLPGPSSGRCHFQLRLRSRRFPRFPVPSQGGAWPQSRDLQLVLVKAFLRCFTAPWVRARSIRTCKTPACLSRSRVHSPASSVWLWESCAPVPPVRRLDSLSGLWRPLLLRRSWCFPLAVSRSRLPAPARWVRCDAVLRDGELPSDVPRKGNGVGRGGTSIGASGSGYAAGAGFPPFRWPDQLSSGMDGILRSLVRVPFRKVRAPRSTLILRSRPRACRCLGSSCRFFRYGISVR